MLSFLGATSCQRSTPTTSQDEIEQAQWELDHGQVDHAINRMKSLVVAEPDNRRARVTLASAYALRAGISASQFSSLAEFWIERNRQGGRSKMNARFQARRMPKADTNVPAAAATSEGSGSSSWEDSLIQGLSFFLDAKENFDLLPVPDSAAKQSDLVLAIQTLEVIQFPSRGEALYRALLRAINLKYQLELGPRVQVVAGGKGCLVGTDDLAAIMLKWLSEGDLTIADFARAYPSQSGWLQSSRQFTARAKLDINSFVSSVAKQPVQTKDIAELVQWANQLMNWKWTCGG